MTKTQMRLAIATVILTGLWIAGCQEEQTTKDDTSYRLIGAENLQLKKENENLKGQIEQLKNQLAKSEEEKLAWKNKAEVELKENIEGILKVAMDENVAQRDEIERLQLEIAKLRGQTIAQTEEKPEQTAQKKEPNEGQAQ